MTDREKVINDFEHEVKKAHGEGWDFVDLTTENGWKVLELLKEQEPRLITKDDFVNADAYGTIPAWVEYHPKLHEAEPVWKIIDIDMLSSPFAKAWTAKPTEEQRKAVKWDD